jgi:ABC-type phosphate transport system permease subunit
MYFGPRIAILYEEIMNPTPRSWVQTWVQRKSGARHLMMATLISVIIAIVIGLCGLAVAIFQAWVSYQQWKHPIASR